MTKILPRRRTTLQFSQILRTLDLIFMANSPPFAIFAENADSENGIFKKPA